MRTDQPLIAKQMNELRQVIADQRTEIGRLRHKAYTRRKAIRGMQRRLELLNTQEALRIAAAQATRLDPRYLLPMEELCAK